MPHIVSGIIERTGKKRGFCAGGNWLQLRRGTGRAFYLEARYNVDDRLKSHAEKKQMAGTVKGDTGGKSRLKEKGGVSATTKKKIHEVVERPSEWGSQLRKKVS